MVKKQRKKRRKGASLKSGKVFPFILPNVMRKKVQRICIERDIDMAEYVRESIELNNRNYLYLIKNCV